MYDVAIIGTGIIGTCIARELSRYQGKVIMIDKESDIASGTTMANSAIIHAGYDAPAEKNKGRFNAPGNKMYEQICSQLDVPYKKIGSLVIGYDEVDMKTLKELYDNGIKNGVEEMSILNQEEVRAIEPNIAQEVVGALFAPTAGIVCPFEMSVALAENAMDNGAELSLNTQITAIDKVDDYYELSSNKGKIQAKKVINCAGVYTDEIYKMVVEDTGFKIKPRKGHYLVLDKSVGQLVKHVIFQCPSDKGKGVLVTPTVHGNILIGPDSEIVDERDNVGTTSERLSYIRNKALRTVEEIPFNQVIRSFTGIRATSDTGDFIIEESPVSKGFYNVAGIESPGLSAAPAIAKYVGDMVAEEAQMEPKNHFIEKRRPVERFHLMTPKEKAELIKKEPTYGRIICRCESVTEGEIIDSIHRNAGATTVKGVKKRTRAGMGRCQGGFCSPRVVEILARELNKEMTDILLDGEGSHILIGRTKA